MYKMKPKIFFLIIWKKYMNFKKATNFECITKRGSKASLSIAVGLQLHKCDNENSGYLVVSTSSSLFLFVFVLLLRRITIFILKIIYSEKVAKILQNLHLTFVLCSASQKEGEYFAKFCGFLRIYEHYLLT